MKKLIPNEMFLKNSMKDFVALLNDKGVKAVALEDGFEYDYDAFVEYAKNTSRAWMPMWFTQMHDANLKWLLGFDKYKEIYG